MKKNKIKCGHGSHSGMFKNIPDLAGQQYLKVCLTHDTEIN
jgi:hypothetical protein